MTQQNINLKLKLSSVIHLHNLTLPIPGSSGYPVAIPTHLTAGKSVCSEQKKKTLLLYLLLWFSGLCLPTINTSDYPTSQEARHQHHKQENQSAFRQLDCNAVWQKWWSCMQRFCATHLVNSLKNRISSSLILHNIILKKDSQ